MRSSRGRRGREAPPRRYPRLARVNEILREVLAEELRELADRDERLGLATVTSVDCDPDFRRAVVYLSSLDESEATALAELRVQMQAAISRQVRLKRTPLLSFAADPAMQAGQRIEEILRDIGPLPADPADDQRDPDVP